MSPSADSAAAKKSVKVESPNVVYNATHIESKYVYQTTDVEVLKDRIKAVPRSTEYTFRTVRKVPKLGVMLVGWGGNNGSTVTAACIANRLAMTWKTKEGMHKANYYGSLTQASTLLLGSDEAGDSVHIPFGSLLPMVDPNDIIFDGWDISSYNLADAMERAKVLDYDLQRQLRPHMEAMKPRPSVYYPDFIAANQAERADNLIPGSDKFEHLNRLRNDIKDFKTTSGVDKVIVLWTANTERFCDIRPGLNDTADNLLSSIRRSEAEVSPSTLFAVASILEGCPFINGSPQNTCVPGVVDLACRENVYIGGDDFKSGQTKLKSVLVDFLVGTGIKPTSIVSYNHLGNNDGMNLSAPQQFRSKEISKSNVVDDMVASNKILYKENEKPDHCVVIKYVPYVGDSKRAMDEYTSQIMMGGHNTISIHNTCEDSLLASPIILDLVILAELCQRISFHVAGQAPENILLINSFNPNYALDLKTHSTEFQPFHSVLSLLSYMLKAPLVPEDTPLVNALFSQRACIENIMRACIGLAPVNHMLLEHKHSIRTTLRVPQSAGDSQLAAASDPESSSDTEIPHKLVTIDECVIKPKSFTNGIIHSAKVEATDN